MLVRPDLARFGVNGEPLDVAVARLEQEECEGSKEEHEEFIEFLKSYVS